MLASESNAFAVKPHRHFSSPLNHAHLFTSRCTLHTAHTTLHTADTILHVDSAPSVFSALLFSAALLVGLVHIMTARMRMSYMTGS